MSRFFMGVLLDLSTIGVVSLGAMPISILGQSTDHTLSDVRYLKPTQLYNVDGTKEATRDYAEHSTIYSCAEQPDVYYLACQIDQKAFLTLDPEKDPKSYKYYMNAVKQIWTEV
jgi:hypothetical protein